MKAIIKDKDREGYYIMIKGSIQEENITLVNIYAPQTIRSYYIAWTISNLLGQNMMENNIIRMYLCMSESFAVKHKLAEHCKSTIL